MFEPLPRRSSGKKKRNKELSRRSSEWGISASYLLTFASLYNLKCLTHGKRSRGQQIQSKPMKPNFRKYPMNCQSLTFGPCAQVGVSVSFTGRSKEVLSITFIQPPHFAGPFAWSKALRTVLASCSAGPVPQ